MIIVIIMETLAAPKLSKYTTALGAYNIESFTHKINQQMHAHPPHTHTHTLVHTCTLTNVRTHEHIVRNSY